MANKVLIGHISKIGTFYQNLTNIFLFIRTVSDLPYYYNKDIRKIVPFVCDMYGLLDQYVRCFVTIFEKKKCAKHLPKCT